MKDYKKNKHYLSNKEMFAEVLKCQKEDKLSNKLGSMYMLMANNYSTKPNFAGYTYKDEMVSAAVVSCCAALHNFNPEKSENTFAYYTSVIHNAFLQVLNKERKQHNIRDELLIAAEMTPSFGFAEREKTRLKAENIQSYESDTTNDVSIDIDITDENEC